MLVDAPAVVVKHLGLVDYVPTVEAMRGFTAGRTPDTPDELWLLQHPPVYTLGVGADPSHGPRAGSGGIPVVQCERGGEITYHGPGQVVLYTLVDLARRGIKVKRFVWLLEQSIIDLLGGRGGRKPGAPGVYIGEAKIAALGLRVSRGRAYHGLALNVDMDLAPFAAIDPCGYPGLPVTQARDQGIEGSVLALGNRLAEILIGKIEHA
jgi:lipoyl(octanoyl) transferase